MTEIVRGSAEHHPRIPCPKCGRQTAVKKQYERGFSLFPHGDCGHLYYRVKLVVFDGFIEVRGKYGSIRVYDDFGRSFEHAVQSVTEGAGPSS